MNYFLNEWESEDLNTGSIIKYGVTPKFSHYAPKLYDYEAYTGITYT